MARKLTKQDVMIVDAGIGIMICFKTSPLDLIIKPLITIKYKGVKYKIDTKQILRRVDYQAGVGIVVQIPGDRAIVL